MFQNPDAALTSSGLQRARSNNERVSGARHSRSEGGICYPPLAHSNFIAHTVGSNLDNAKQQFLLPPTDVVPSIRDHQRMSPGGFRERGIGGMGQHSTPDRARASPYPSPNASPPIRQSRSNNILSDTPPEASERQRKMDANFVCPVPGCGSTFTRHFNLKGALRQPLREVVLTCRYRSLAFA